MHAAESRHVDRDARQFSARRRIERHRLRILDRRRPLLCDRDQFLRVQRGVHLQAARHEIELIHIACVEPGAVDRDAAILGPEPRDVALLVEFRRARDERHAARIDEARAVHADPVRVRDDHARLLPRDFRRAREHRCVTAHHLVQDHLRRPAAEPRVAVDAARQLRVRAGHAVVQHEVILANVVVGEAVGRNAGGIRCVDVDDRRAVRRGAEAWAVGRARIHDEPRLRVRGLRRENRHRERQRRGKRGTREWRRRALARVLLLMFHGLLGFLKMKGRAWHRPHRTGPVRRSADGRASVLTWRFPP